MKNKSAFAQIMLLVAVLLVCIVLTVTVALVAGSVDITIFNFENLNFANMIPVLIVGVFVTCVAVGITVMFVSRSLFLKVKEHFINNEEEN